MAKDETVFDSLKGLPRPRGQHYEFSHSALPGAFLADPGDFLHKLSGPEGRGLPAEIWRACRQRNPSSEDRVEMSSPSVTLEELPGGHRCALAVMPAAERVGESHFSATVVLPGARRLGLFKSPARIRHFTLDVSMDAGKRPTTALLEWLLERDGGLRHRPVCDGLAAGRDAFLAAVAEALDRPAV